MKRIASTILILTLAGCAVSGPEINRAIEFCKDYGGIQWVSDGEVRCKEPIGKSQAAVSHSEVKRTIIRNRKP